MNDNRQPYQQGIDKQLGTLLAFVILFEKKIESLRIKLAGNQQFHSRLAFQFIDSRRKCIISPVDLTETLSKYSSPTSIGQVEAYCRKYTTNGSFSYDEFIKLLTPKTNKILAQRLMIRTYRTGAQLPTYILKILFEILAAGISMISITENLRKKIQQSSRLTHVQLLQFFKKCCSTRQRLFYFINSSTQGGNQEYDFSLEQMDYLCFHVKNNCDLQQILDHQIKQILCPLDMNFQKTFSNTFYTEPKNRTDYFKGKTIYGNSIGGNENLDSNNRTVNFLKTNYRQTSKNFYQKGGEKMRTGFSSKQLFQGVDENVVTKQPTHMIYRTSFPTQYNSHSANDKMINPIGKLAQNGLGDESQISSSVNYRNMYIQKFAKVAPTNDYSQGGQQNGRQINLLANFLKNNQKMPYQRPKQQFQDDFNPNRSEQFSDQMSRGSAFVQY